MKHQSINTYTAWHPILRPIARVVIAAQLALVLQPLSVLAQDQGQMPFNPAAQAQVQRLGALSQRMEQAKAQRVQAQQSPADQVSTKLERTEELVHGLNPTPRKASAKSSGNISAAVTTATQGATATQRQERLQELRQQLSDIRGGSASVKAEFDAARTELTKKQLPAEILARHDATQSQFEQRARQFEQVSARLGATTATETPDQQQALQELQQFFEQYPSKRRQSPIKPGKLPWSTPKPTTRMPAESASVSTAPQARRAFMSAQRAAPLPADLAETDEVQLTPAIRAKALELGNNPVTIYNWVRNSIEFAPTAGAIQSAQDTLDKKRGNATDTASLLIALLRAANIPARYQFGTIDVSADKVQNWVGGTTKPEAALQILNQGGIAATGIASGGRITTIRLEHVWVNAYVNWTPSRGNRNASASQHLNPNDQLNAWVPLDASYKQYSYTQGMDLKTQVPLDANALLTAAQQGATVNEAQGWVQNLNQTAIQSQLGAYQTRLKTYIDSTPTGPNSTVGDVIGKKIIPQQAQPMLAGTLQNVVVMQAQEVSAIPANLQHKFTYRLYASQTDQANENPMLSFTEKTSRLVGKRLTLSYVPATQADADTIASYLPKPHADGRPIQPSELPTSLPGYLIKLKPQINLDGVVVASSNSSVQMGTDLYSTGGFTQLYDASQWDLTSEESNVAGNATAIGISAGGISATQLTQLKDRLTTAQTKLQAKDVTGLTGEQVSGELITATIWGWFAAAESHNRLSQNEAGMIENPGLSYGLFHAVANPLYSWGVIRKVTFPGLNMDIGHVRNLTWSKDNDASSWVAYNRLRGQYMSALEHAVPERFFNDSAQCNPEGTTTPNAALPVCPQGISAVKAIALGAQAGQKIFTITAQVYQDNPNIVSTQLSAHSAATKNQIQQALDAGYEVTIHEAPITQKGWAGAGFTMIDPATGAGGYIIDGGSNGAIFLIVFIGLVISMLLPIFLFTGGYIGVLGLLLGVGGGGWNAANFVKILGEISTFEEFNELAAFTSIKAYSSIAFGFFAKYLYGVGPEFGPINGRTGYTIFNATFLFFSGLFK